MIRAFAFLFLLLFTPAANAAGVQPPTLRPLIHDLEKTSNYIAKRVDPGAIERVELPAIPKKDLRGLTSVKHPVLVYNIRRVSDEAGASRDTLYAFLPDVTEQACASHKNAGHGTGRPYVISAQSIKLAPDRYIILDDPAPLPAGVSCIQMPDRRLLLTVVLVTRVKGAGDKAWAFAAK